MHLMLRSLAYLLLFLVIFVAALLVHSGDGTFSKKRYTSPRTMLGALRDQNNKTRTSTLVHNLDFGYDQQSLFWRVFVVVIDRDNNMWVG